MAGAGLVDPEKAAADLLDGYFYPEDFNAVGDGVADDSVPLQNALDAAATAGGGTVTGQKVGSTYLCHGVEVPSNVTLKRVQLKHKANSTTYCVAAPAISEDAAIENVTIDGNSPNISAMIPTIRIAGTRASVAHCRIYDSNRHAMLIDGDSPNIISNYIYAKNALTSTEGSDPRSAIDIRNATAVICAFNHVRDTADVPASHGIVVGTGTNTYCLLIGNRTTNTGGGGVTGYTHEQSEIVAVNNLIESPGNNGMHFGGDGITIADNTIVDAAHYGIIVSSEDQFDVVHPSDDLVIVGNRVLTTGDRSGIQINAYSGVVVDGNVVRDAGVNGISISGASGASADVTVADNVVRGCSSHGIVVIASETVVISGNIASANGSRGIVVSGASSDVLATGNIAKNNTASQTRVQDTASDVFIRDNLLRGPAPFSNTTSGTVYVGRNDGDISASVAAAADTTLPLGREVVTVTGSTAINTITAAGQTGNRVTLLWGASASFDVTETGNIKLSATIAAHNADDTLTLVCDGTNWYEVARSAN